MKTLLCAFAALVFMAGWVQAQQSADSTYVVEIVHADSSVGMRLPDGEQVRALLGHVFLRQGDTEIRAQEAWQYIYGGKIVLRGNVFLVEEGKDTLRAPEVIYNSQTKTGEARQRIRFSDGEVVVEAPAGVYFLEEDRVEVWQGVSLQDSLVQISSRKGTYWLDTRKAVFRDSVSLTQDDIRISADTLWHDRTSGISEATGHVIIQRVSTDSSTWDWMLGPRLTHQREEGYTSLSGRPLWVRWQQTDAAQDTLLIRADRFEVVEDDSLKQVIAVGQVIVWKEKLAAVADSAVYKVPRDSAAIESLTLFGSPVGWIKQLQVTGDTLQFSLQEGHPQQVQVWRHAFVGVEDTVIQRIHQMKGEVLQGFFRQDTLHQVHLGPRAEAIYFVTEEDSVLAGAVQLSADSLRFTLRQEQLEQLKAIKGIEGTYYDRAIIPTPFALEGFSWMPHKRPIPADFLDEPWMRNWVYKQLQGRAADRNFPKPKANVYVQ